MTNQRPAVEEAYPPDILARLVNPAGRLLLRSPLGGPLRRRYMLLSFTGRKTGRRYTVPVTVHRAEGELYVLTSAGWRHNFRGGGDVEVLLEGRTVPMRGDLLEDPAEVAGFYSRRINEYGRRMAQIEISIKINVPRTPTLEELTEAAERIGLSVIKLSSVRS